MTPGGSPPLQSGGQNQKWPKSGQGGYITPAALGVPTTSERGAKSEVAHKRARWLHNPCRLGLNHGRSQILDAPAQAIPANVPGVVHNPLLCYIQSLRHSLICTRASDMPPGESPPLQSGGRNKKWPTSGRGGYITPAAWKVPTTSERGTKSEVAQKWARWLHNPCRLGGSPPLQSGGKN